MYFETIRTASLFDSLEREWNDLLSHSATHVPFLRHEYQAAWWRTLGGGEWKQGELNVVTYRSAEGELRGIAPLFFTPNRDQESALMLLGCIEISDYLDVIARPEHLPGFIGQLLPYLVGQNAQAWSILDWYNLPEGSPTLPALQAAAAQQGWSYSQERLGPAPHVPLPGNWETYLAGIDKKQRHEVRRKMRRIESNATPARWYIVADGANLEAEIEAFLDLMARDPKKATFLSAAMRSQMHAAAQAAFRANWLQLSFLEVGGEKAAGYLNFDFDNRVWVYNSGLDFRFRELSPGWVLLAYLLQWANENKRAAFDFLRGAEDYKYRFGGIDRFVVRARVRR